MKYRVAADIGGTFTDFVIEDTENKKTLTSKVLSNPSNASIAVLKGLKESISNFNEINFLVHGTTVGLNAFLERKGARVLLIMTSGISDTYTIARGDRKTLYDVQYRKPKQLASRKDVHEVYERMSWEGKVIEPLDEKSFQLIIKKINNEKIKQLISYCKLSDFIETLHLKEDTNVGELGSRISEGQKQRIGLARALYKDPEILVLDEFTSSLDVETENEIMKIIESLKGKKTIFIISHRQNAIKYCNKVLDASELNKNVN